MERVPLGRTGLSASVVGLGCGGPSRLGLAYGRSPREMTNLVAAAIDAGINLIDTAPVYGTESVVGVAIAGRRDDVILSTKFQIESTRGGNLIDEAEIRRRMDLSLRALATDYVDILHLHGVLPAHYAHARERLVPVLQALRAEGKLRFIGVTERFISDTSHAMLRMAVMDDVWDVMMLGFNLLNPSARHEVLPTIMKKGIGTLCMFAVRRAIAQPDMLCQLVRALAGRGEIDGNAINLDDPLDFLTGPDDAETVVEAAYRFCRHEPGIDVVLTGTGNAEHLAANISSLLKPPLRDELRATLDEIFGHLDSVSAN